MKKVIIFLCLIFAFSLNANALTDVSAKSAVLINGDTGEALFSKNQNEQLPMASTTKIMTALLLAEAGTPEKEITVTKEMVTVEGSSMGLLAGDIVSYRDLLYGMLLASGNDAANSTAYILGGGIKGFAQLMNKRAKEIGLLHTNFVTPSGLDDENHFTTASDLAKLARFAMRNEAFYESASSKSAILNYGNPPYRRQLTNHNKLLNLYDGAVGVKTGFTKKSGRCLVSAAKRNNKYLIAVTLNAPSDWQDHSNLLDFGFELLKEKSFSADKKEFLVPVISGETDSVKIKIPDFNIAVANEEIKDFTVEYSLPEFLYAPLEKGERAGLATLKYKNEIIRVADLTCDSDVEIRREESTFFDSFLQVFMLCLKQI